MAKSDNHHRFTLKDSVYVAVEPVSGACIEIPARAEPRLAPLPFATLSRSFRPLAERCARLHNVDHEIVRVDA